MFLAICSAGCINEHPETNQDLYRVQRREKYLLRVRQYLEQVVRREKYGYLKVTLHYLSAGRRELGRPQKRRKCSRTVWKSVGPGRRRGGKKSGRTVTTKKTKLCSGIDKFVALYPVKTFGGVEV